MRSETKSSIPLLTPELRRQVRYILHDRDNSEALVSFRSKLNSATSRVSLSPQTSPITQPKETTLSEVFKELMPIRARQLSIASVNSNMGERASMSANTARRMSSFGSEIMNGRIGSTRYSIIDPKLQRPLSSHRQSISLQLTTKSKRIRTRFQRICGRLLNAIHFMKELNKRLETPCQLTFDYEEARAMSRVLSKRMSSASFSKPRVHSAECKVSLDLLKELKNLNYSPTIQDSITEWISTVKFFQQFTRQMQLELLKKCYFERWNHGRTLVKEGRRSYFVYIILDGQVSASSFDKLKFQTMINDIPTSPQMTRIYERALTKKIKSQCQTTHILSNCGDVIGDMQLETSTIRSSTAVTLKSTDFLVLSIYYQSN